MAGSLVPNFSQAGEYPVGSHFRGRFFSRGAVAVSLFIVASTEPTKLPAILTRITRSTVFFYPPTVA